MKKTVIVNWGHSNQGKSDTIKKIAEEIIKNYPNAILNPLVIDFSADIKVIITLENVKIGIESQGDPNSRIFSSLKEFAQENCDLIICTTRTSGATVEAVKDIKSEFNYEIIWTTNYRSNDINHNSLNYFYAGQIFELIQNLINNKI